MSRSADVIDLVAWRARREDRGPAASDAEVRSRVLVAERFAEGWECLSDEIDAPWP